MNCYQKCYPYHPPKPSLSSPMEATVALSRIFITLLGNLGLVGRFWPKYGQGRTEQRITRFMLICESQQIVRMRKTSMAMTKSDTFENEEFRLLLFTLWNIEIFAGAHGIEKGAGGQFSCCYVSLGFVVSHELSEN
eukprot:scaffold44002_cov45-Attheya_sp.AAC.1